MIGAYIVGVLNAVIVLVTAFGLSLTTNQIGAIQGVANAVILLVTALLHWKQGTKSSNSTVAPPRSTIQ